MLGFLGHPVLRVLVGPQYVASCDYIKGEWRWFVGDRYIHNTLVTAKDHRNLIPALKRYMQRNCISELTIEWDNDGTIETVKVQPK